MRSTRILGGLVAAALVSTIPATVMATDIESIEVTAETEPFEVSESIRSCLRQANAELEGTGVQIRRADFDMVFLGADGPDDFDGYVTLGRDLLCGFGGNDSVGLGGVAWLGDGDVFVGGAGRDQAETVAGGIVIGGSGDDRLRFLGEDGLFVGGADHDSVFRSIGSKVYGGDGDDGVSRLISSRFEGGAGNDRVSAQFDNGSRFIGGPGNDRVDAEMTSGLFRGGSGRDYVETVGALARFAGGDAKDRVGRVQGVFVSGGGNDRAGLVDGQMYGGVGNDRICQLAAGGVFDGGPGSDTVGIATGGRASAIERIVPCP